MCFFLRMLRQIASQRCSEGKKHWICQVAVLMLSLALAAGVLCVTSMSNHANQPWCDVVDSVCPIGGSASSPVTAIAGHSCRSAAWMGCCAQVATQIIARRVERYALHVKSKALGAESPSRSFKAWISPGLPMCLNLPCLYVSSITEC